MGKEIRIDELIELMSDENTPITASHRLAASILRTIFKEGSQAISEVRDIPFDMKSIIDYDQIDLFTEFEFKKEINMIEEYMRKIVVKYEVEGLCGD